LLRENITAIQR